MLHPARLDIIPNTKPVFVFTTPLKNQGTIAARIPKIKKAVKPDAWEHTKGCAR